MSCAFHLLEWINTASHSTSTPENIWSSPTYSSLIHDQITGLENK